jgi:hypothetical protein
MGGSASQKQTSESTGTTTSTLPGNQQQNVDLLMKGARDFYNTGGPQYFGGQTYAGVTPGETLGRQQVLDYAGGAGQDYINAAQAGDKFWMNPENIFNPQNIPGFAAAQQGLTRDITRNLTENELPQLRGGSLAQGALGGSRQEIGEGLATARTNEGIGNALAGMDMQAYAQGLNMANSAANRAPSMFNLGLAPGQIQQDIGGLERADTQQGIDAAISKFNFEQLAPYFNLQMLQELTGRGGQYGGTVNSSESGTAKTSTSGGSGQGITQGLGGLLTMMSMFPGMGG